MLHCPSGNHKFISIGKHHVVGVLSINLIHCTLRNKGALLCTHYSDKFRCFCPRYFSALADSSFFLLQAGMKGRESETGRKVGFRLVTRRRSTTAMCGRGTCDWGTGSWEPPRSTHRQSCGKNSFWVLTGGGWIQVIVVCPRESLSRSSTKWNRTSILKSCWRNNICKLICVHVLELG